VSHEAPLVMVAKVYKLKARLIAELASETAVRKGRRLDSAAMAMVAAMLRSGGLLDADP